MREPVLNAAPAQAPAQAMAFTPTQFGTLSAGEIVTVALDLEGAAAEVMLSSSTGHLSLTLTTPDGRLLTPANVGQFLPGAQYTGPIAPDDPPLTAYQLPNLPAGRWLATIAATNVLTETTYALFAMVQSPLTLEVEQPTSVAPGQPFQLRTILRDGANPVDGALVNASLPTTQGPQVVTLTQTAPGVYSGQLSAPADAGPHLLTVTASGTSTTPFAHQLDELITVRAGGVQRQSNATVTPLDQDGNGRYEGLQVAVTYAATSSGDYAALAVLQDTAGRAITLARTQATWTAGTNTLTFTFDGREIAASNVDGPYRVVAQVVTEDGAQLVADEQPLVDGLPYQASNFEGQSYRLYLPLLRR